MVTSITVDLFATIAVFIYVDRTCMNPKAAAALSLLGKILLLSYLDCFEPYSNLNLLLLLHFQNCYRSV